MNEYPSDIRLKAGLADPWKSDDEHRELRAAVRMAADGTRTYVRGPDGERLAVIAPPGDVVPGTRVSPFRSWTALCACVALIVVSALQDQWWLLGFACPLAALFAAHLLVYRKSGKNSRR